ncbi:MAG: hypothetical protein RSC76_00940 [Oscillospiraceae bacterium]
MKRIFVFLSLFVVIVFFPVLCSADELAEIIPVDPIYDVLSSDNKKALEAIEVESVEDMQHFSWEKIFSLMSETFRDQFLSPLKILLSVMVIIMISSFLCAYNNEYESICQLAGSLAVCTLLIPHLVGLIANTKIVCEGISAFMMAAIPVYAALLVSSGNLGVGSAYGGISILAANVLSQVSNNILVPSLSVFLGLSISSSFSHINIKNITESVYKLVKGLMIFAVTAFSGIISVQSVISGATDAATVKTAKFIASTTIPIIGSALGEGVSAVQNSIKILKSGVSAFGIIATFAIFLSPVIQTLLWICTVQLSVIIGDLFDAKKIKEFLFVILIVLKMILAILLSLCIISIVTAAITLFVGA